MPRKPRRSRLANYRRLAPSDRQMTREALQALISIRARLAAMSWQRFSRSLGMPVTGEVMSEWDREWETTTAVVRAIERWHRLSPQSSTCLVRALAAQRMLAARRIPCTLVLGVRQESGGQEITAHAWVRVGAEIVVGRHEAPDYAPVASYQSCGPEEHPSHSAEKA
jgi:hypothetical protein